MRWLLPHCRTGGAGGLLEAGGGGGGGFLAAPASAPKVLEFEVDTSDRGMVDEEPIDCFETTFDVPVPDAWAPNVGFITWRISDLPIV